MTSPSPAAAPLVYPLGHYLGARHATGEFQVRLADRVHALDQADFSVWALTHGSPTRSPGAWTADAVVSAAAGAGHGDARAALDRLSGQGLVRAAVPDGESGRELARAVRMIPLVLGLGQRADDPHAWSVGLVGRPLVDMSATVYNLFSWAHLNANLWSACEAGADAGRREGLSEIADTDPGAMLAHLLGSLHTLLAPNAVYLDTWNVG